ncbi:MAG: hypothetical protein K2Y21_08870 [Phycisphaerales bacterium]|nr:hypothetical protein [Phycisphaerales bacterium]
MTDISALGIFFACLISTLGLVRACDALRPRDGTRTPSVPNAASKEPRP